MVTVKKHTVILLMSTVTVYMKFNPAKTTVPVNSDIPVFNVNLDSVFILINAKKLDISRVTLINKNAILQILKKVCTGKLSL